MQKQMLIRHLNVALIAQRRAVNAATEKYGTNHLLYTTLRMEEKELADYIDKLQSEIDKKSP